MHFSIKEARVQGRLDKIEGWGEPMLISNDEKNPFVSREEFLVNRIVRRNGAAPPWAELQAGKLRFIPMFFTGHSNTISVEMGSAVASFRQVLRQFGLGELSSSS